MYDIDHVYIYIYMYVLYLHREGGWTFTSYFFAFHYIQICQPRAGVPGLVIAIHSTRSLGIRRGSASPDLPNRCRWWRCSNAPLDSWLISWWTKPMAWRQLLVLELVNWWFTSCFIHMPCLIFTYDCLLWKLDDQKHSSTRLRSSESRSAFFHLLHLWSCFSSSFWRSETSMTLGCQGRLLSGGCKERKNRSLFWRTWPFNQAGSIVESLEMSGARLDDHWFLDVFGVPGPLTINDHHQWRMKHIPKKPEIPKKWNCCFRHFSTATMWGDVHGWPWILFAGLRGLIISTAPSFCPIRTCSFCFNLGEAAAGLLPLLWAGHRLSSDCLFIHENMPCSGCLDPGLCIDNKKWKTDQAESPLLSSSLHKTRKQCNSRFSTSRSAHSSLRLSFNLSPWSRFHGQLWQFGSCSFLKMWRFPKIGVPPVIIHFIIDGFSLCKPSSYWVSL